MCRGKNLNAQDAKEEDAVERKEATALRTLRSSFANFAFHHLF
jgi:hypothetical protein